MNNINIREKCRVNTNYNEDTFVGIKCTDGDISINFPLGFNISEKDDDLRKDILMLFSVLANNTSKNDSQFIGRARNYEFVQFPIQAYMYVIQDYLARGYYTEREVDYRSGKRGKINWGRTIKTQKSYLCQDGFFYLDYVVKNKNLKENELITLIHEYCVYDAFSKIGWLFTSLIPEKPYIKFNKRLFVSVLKDKLGMTFNDRNKQLFKNMIAIINFEGDVDASHNYKYGTYRFEYIWEKIIDKVFGISNKADYFPKTVWMLKDNIYSNASLEPDTIMLYNENVYVLDAKYYKYGVTSRPGDLPESTSINKQITYGEFIYNNRKFKCKHGERFKVYNAFIMPYNSNNNKFGSKQNMITIGEALSDWKDNDKEYHHVIGILLDIKYAMSVNFRSENSKIMNLATLINSQLN